jgi:hypothetical protein
MSISAAMPPTQDLHALLSQPLRGTTAFAAGPGTVIGLIVIAALVGGAIARVLATLWTVIRSMLALLASMAAVLAAVIILVNLSLSNTVRPAEPSGGSTAPPTPAVGPTAASPPSHPLPPAMSGHHQGTPTR